MNDAQIARKTITLRGLTECPSCGYSRATTTDREEAKLVQDWLTAQGKEPRKAIRDYKPTVGGFSFGHGGGYAILDADMLGGTGDGRTQSRFLKETGISGFEYPSRGIRSTVCRECRRGLEA